MRPHGRKPTSYAKATFATSAALADEAAAILVANGALGCAVAGGLRAGTGGRRSVRLEAFFERLDRGKVARLERLMRVSGLLASRSRGPAIRHIVDPGWATQWQDHFSPFRVGHRFLIVPPWNESCAPGRLTIVIKPAQAFGTGHHATTRGALLALEELWSAGSFRTVLDVGTGSGILAIAAQLLGARAVTAVDTDPVALENSRENAALNGLDRAIRFSAAPVAALRGRFDLITANILSTTLIELAPTLTRLLGAEGRLVLGGILEREAQAVIRAYRPALRCWRARSARGWTTLVMAR